MWDWQPSCILLLSNNAVLNVVQSTQKWFRSLVAQMVKNPPAVQETQAQCLDGEDPLEKRMPTHSSILALRIPWTDEPRGSSDTTE